MKIVVSLLGLFLIFGTIELSSQDIIGKWHGVNCSGIEVIDHNTMFIANHDQEFKYRIRKDKMILNSEVAQSFFGEIHDYRYKIIVHSKDSLILIPWTSEYNLFLDERDARLFFVRVEE